MFRAYIHCGQHKLTTKEYQTYKEAKEALNDLHQKWKGFQYSEIEVHIKDIGWVLYQHIKPVLELSDFAPNNISTRTDIKIEAIINILQAMELQEHHDPLGI